MPYGISNSQEDCSTWATVKQEDDGSYTTLACHDSKEEAIDQMVAISLDEGVEALGEINSTNKKARSKMKKTERRTFTVRDIEARQAEDGTMRMAGYAAVFNEASLPLPFIEKIAPGAFTKTLQETPDVRLLANHEGLPMARTKNGTMRLYEDERGLYFEAELANTQEARDLYTLVERGDVDQMSFAFRVIRQNWSKDRTERTLTEVSLADGDVSIVTYPAYPATSVEAREAIKRAILQIKEGREVSGDSLLVLESVFGDLAEGHEYIMKAVEVMGTLLGNNGVEGEEEDSSSPLEDVEEQELETSTSIIDVVDVPGQGAKIVGDHPSVLNFLPDNMPRSMSLRLAKAKRNNIK
jgi:HK97 family phage prohead protease